MPRRLSATRCWCAAVMYGCIGKLMTRFATASPTGRFAVERYGIVDCSGDASLLERGLHVFAMINLHRVLRPRADIVRFDEWRRRNAGCFQQIVVAGCNTLSRRDLVIENA